MVRSGAFLRWVPRRRFVLPLAVGVASLGMWLSAAPASVNANVLIDGVKIAMRTVNNSSHSVTASYCPIGHVTPTNRYNRFNTNFPYPCNFVLPQPAIAHVGQHPVAYTHHLAGGGGRFTYASNPFGETISNSHKTLAFYAHNPTIGLPYIEFNGEKVHMVQGELVTRHAIGATVRFHREGDRDGHKQMTIEIISMG